MKTYFIAQYRVSQRNTLIYFEWIYLSILPPPIFMVLEGGGGWKCFSPFYIGVEGRKCYVLISTPILWHYWKGILSKNITMPRKGFYNIPGQNGCLSSLVNCLTLTGCYLSQGYHTLYTPVHCLLHHCTPLLKTRYFSKRGYNKSCWAVPNMGLNILNFVFIDTLFNKM